MIDNKYGALLHSDIKIHRQYFSEMLRLLGIQVIYRAPKRDKQYTLHTEVFANYEQPILTSCIFTEHPDQKTLKKMGWVAELQDNASIIHVPYDLPGLQRGALFIVPSGIDNAQGRVFKVNTMMNSMVYPASIACEIVPEYENTFSNDQFTYQQTDFNLLSDEEEEDEE